ncbi:pseudouridine synthase [Mycoplasma sp. 1018B]|uniref:pseudouridine synthase n=1 Tax=Mycoplasma sp. 1018B TaxID=2967302 RepID=UPI00211C2C31|nr:pseudouridine synthase [Mycoplasma sp. 1018B]UUM19073.1 pseudouridine synthase [Mycoplasma sp. 1018B]
MNNNNLIRIQKLIAQSGFCSRRKAEELILAKKIKVNGSLAQIGQLVSVNDQITINNQIINLNNQNNFVYFLLNKPKKTITTTKDPFKRKTVIDLIDIPYRIVPVGRLDYDTTGVLLLTNDLEMVNKLSHPKYEIKRIYRARINEPLTLKEFKLINKEVLVNGKISKQIVDQVADKSYTVELHVGSYHHIKELFKVFNKKVINLKRIQYANLTTEKIPEGYYRKLKLKEIKDLKTIIRIQEERLKKINEKKKINEIFSK